MKRLGTIMMTALLVGIFGTLQAQYTGPGSTAMVKTVKEVSNNALKLDRKDTMVKLRGFIIEQLGDENYMFKDASGKIRVEIDKKRLPAATFNENTEMVIIGEVDYDLLEDTEVEVKNVEIKVTGTKEENTTSTAG